MRKKSQVSGQVFVYVLSAIIFAFIMLYGYKAISSFIDKGEDVKLIQLRTDLTTSIKKISTSSDVRKLELIIPSTFDKLCLINSYPSGVDGTESSGSDLGNPSSSHYNPLIFNSWKDEVQQDAFLVPHTDFQIYIGKMQIDTSIHNKWSCFNIVNGRVELRLEGLGDGAKVSACPTT